MKKYLLYFAAVAFSLSSVAQCVNDYDWGDATFGVSPDPEVGETFADGVLNMPYEDSIFMLLPNDASEVDETFPSLPIDSAILNSIVITQGENSYTPEEFGLTLTCNNGGASEDPCTFMGGQSGCGLLSGTPLIPGEFNVTIAATIYVTVIGSPVPFPFDYDGYTITINTNISVPEIADVISEVRITPNPFTSRALIQFNSLNAGLAAFKVFNLLGEEKMNEVINLERGLNKLPMSSEELDSGVYLYYLEFEDFKITKRFVVDK